MARIKVASAKAKGANLQRWVVRCIADLFDVDLGSYHTKDDHPVQSRPASQTGVDVILSPELRRRFPFSVECKSGQAIGWQATVRQARANQLPGTYWLAVMKTKEFRKPVAIVDAELLFSIVAMLPEDWNNA